MVMLSPSIISTEPLLPELEGNGLSPQEPEEPEVESLVQDPCINQRDEYGRTPLYVAAQSGQRDAVMWLLHHGADVTIPATNQEELGRTALHAAARSGHVDILHILLAYGANVDLQDGCGDTCLHVASLQCQLDSVKVLICNGCDTNIPNSNGDSALLAVVKSIGYSSDSQYPIVSLLLECSRTTTQDKTGRSVVHILAARHQEGLMRLACKLGHDLNLQDLDLRTPLHYCLENPDYIHVGCVRVLLNYGADPQWPDNKGTTPLLLMMRHKDCRQPALHSLLREWIYTHMPEFGQSLLHLAVLAADRELLEFLMTLGVDPDLQDNSGQAPAHLAATEGKADMLQVLLDNKASANLRDACHMMPLHYAAMHERPACTAALLTAGAEISGKDRGGLTALHRAIGWGHRTNVSALIEAGAGLNEFENVGRRPLHLAVDTGNYPVTSMLLRAGAEVNVQDIYGSSPLHISASRGRRDLLRTLLQSGATLDCKDSHGRTPLHCAAQAGHLPIVELLIEEGANITARDRQGNRPDQVAAVFSHHVVVEVLRREHRRSMLFYKDEAAFATENWDGTFTLPRTPANRKAVAKAASCDVICAIEEPPPLQRNKFGNNAIKGAISMDFGKLKDRKLTRPGKGACCVIS